jgi:hypothetical protein
VIVFLTFKSNLLTYVGISMQDKGNSHQTTIFFFKRPVQQFKSTYICRNWYSGQMEFSPQNRSMIDHNHNFASHKCTAAITSTAAPAPQAEQQQHHNQRPTTCVSTTAAAAAAAKQHHHSKSHHHHLIIISKPPNSRSSHHSPLTPA